MRWVVLLLLLAGCIASIEEPSPETKILLLGADACHEGICYRGDRDEVFRHLLQLERTPMAIASVGEWVVWTDSEGAWAFDRETRSLRPLTTGPTTLVPYEDGVVVAHEDRIASWAIDADDWRTITRGPNLDLLGAGHAGVYVADRSSGLRFLTYDWDGETVHAFAPGRSGGQVFAGDNGNSVFWVLSDATAEAWHQIGSVVAPVWSGPSVSRVATDAGRLWMGSNDTFWRVDTVNGDTEAIQEGRLMDAWGAEPVWVQRDEFADKAIIMGERPPLLGLYPVDGKAVLHAHRGNAGLLVALSGATTTLAVPV